MKFKRILSAFAAVTMALSAFNFTYAADTTEESNIIIQDHSFSASNMFDYYMAADGSTAKRSTEVNREGSAAGSLEYKTVGGSRFVDYIARMPGREQLTEGDAYLFKAYIKGERIAKKETNVKISYTSAKIEKVVYAKTNGTVKQGEWNEIKFYFVSSQRHWNDKISMEFTDATTGKEDVCDLFYIDDITVEKLGKSDEVFANTQSGFSKFDKDVTLKYAFASLDVAKTKNVLIPGEETEVKAYLQDGAKGTTAAALTRTAADLNNITVASSDVSVVSYANGKIIANGSGNAVLTYTYSDGTTTATAKQLITVSSNEANIVDTKYATITDPIDDTDTAKIPVYSKNIDLGIAANTPAVVSYRIYFNGRNAVGSDANCLGKTAILFSGSVKESADVHGERYEDGTERMSYFRIGDNYYPNGGKRDLPINSGWNNIDFVTEYPAENSYNDGYMKVSLWVNGNMCYAKELKLSNSSANLLFTSADNGAVIMDDLMVVSMKEPLMVKSTNPANGEKLSTLDDIDVEFNQTPSITDIANSAELYYGEEKIETVNTFYAAKNTLSVRPANGLKPNLKYTLKLNKELIKTNTGEELSGDTVLAFTTDSVKVSDVIGNGYTLLNSQYDMIRNGSYKVNDKGEMVTEKDGSLVLRLPNEPEDNKGNSVSVSAEDSFLATKDADRIIVEFDTKVETTADNPNNLEYAIWSINGKNADNQGGTLTKLGRGRYSANRAFGVIWNYLTNNTETGDKKATYPQNENGDENSIFLVDKDFKLDNKGYAHVKIVYDLKQKDEKGDVAQTIYLTCGGKEYIYEDAKATTTIDTGYMGITNITGIMLSMNQVTVDRTAYLKNVNMYAVKLDPDSVPNAEITLSALTGDDLADITTADGLNGKKVNFKASLTNNKLVGNQSYAIIVAAYDKDTNKLIDMKYQSGTVTIGETVNFENNESTALDLTGHTSGTAVIKVFAWNSLDGAIPLVDAYTHQF